MMKNVLITGSSGFIGQKIVKELLKKNVYLYLLINKKKIKIKSKKIKFISCSLLNFKKLKKKLRKLNITDIIHCAWMGVAANKRNNQRQDINLKITDNLLNSIYQKKINSFITLGSQAEYGSKFKKIKENSKTKPITRYGKTKIKIFKKIKIFCKTNKIRFVWLRVFSGYGPNSHKNWIINSTILKLINNQKTKFTTGRQIYNFIYVTDIVSGIIKCLYNRKATGIFNLASEKSYSIRYIVRLIFRKLKTKKKPVFGELSYRSDQVMKTLPSISKPRNKLKWQPTISIHKGLNKTINFLKKNNSN